jgi:hypothetical protein
MQKKLSPTKCDAIRAQYQGFLNNVVHPNSLMFSEFSYKADRIDEFYQALLRNKDEFSDLWSVIRMILILSHGQASVERGFSTMKQTAKDNMSAESFTAKRVILDHMKSVGGCLGVVITTELRKEVKQSRQRYMAFLEANKNREQKKQESEKRKLLVNEIEELKNKRQRFLDDASVLEKSADEFSVKAESARSFADVKSFVTKSNSHRASAKVKRENVLQLESQITEKTSRLQSTL